MCSVGQIDQKKQFQLKATSKNLQKTSEVAKEISRASPPHKATNLKTLLTTKAFHLRFHLKNSLSQFT